MNIHRNGQSLKTGDFFEFDPLELIEQFYTPGDALYTTLVEHSQKVARKSLDIAEHIGHLNPDMDFIEKAAMLHDIGIFKTRATSIGCTGPDPYIRHGILGRDLLDGLGLPPEYGLVCERHTGAGITKENILAAGLPLPPRDMVPVSLEEKIICAADKYFSKSPKKGGHPLSTGQVIESLEKISPDHARRFSGWARTFNL